MDTPTKLLKQVSGIVCQPLMECRDHTEEKISFKTVVDRYFSNFDKIINQ